MFSQAMDMSLSIKMRSMFKSNGIETSAKVCKYERDGPHSLKFTTQQCEKQQKKWVNIYKAKFKVSLISDIKLLPKWKDPNRTYHFSEYLKIVNDRETFRDTFSYFEYSELMILREK